MSNRNLDAKVCAALRARADALRLEREVARDAEIARAAELLSTPPAASPAAIVNQIVHPNPGPPSDLQIAVVSGTATDGPSPSSPQRIAFSSQPQPIVPSSPPQPIGTRPANSAVLRAVDSNPSSSDDQLTFSSSPENRTQELPRQDPNWFDMLLRIFDEFRAAHGDSTWYRVLRLILSTALVIGIFLLAGSVVLLAIHGKTPPNFKAPSDALSWRSLCSMLNLTLPICAGNVTAPGAKTAEPGTETFDLSDLSEHYKFQNFLLVQNPLTRVCAVFPGLNPRARRFTVLPFADFKELLVDSEVAKFGMLCDSEKVYKAVRP